METEILNKINEISNLLENKYKIKYKILVDKDKEDILNIILEMPLKNIIKK